MINNLNDFNKVLESVKTSSHDDDIQGLIIFACDQIKGHGQFEPLKRLLGVLKPTTKRVVESYLRSYTKYRGIVEKTGKVAVSPDGVWDLPEDKSWFDFLEATKKPTEFGKEAALKQLKGLITRCNKAGVSFEEILASVKS